MATAGNAQENADDSSTLSGVSVRTEAGNIGSRRSEHNNSGTDESKTMSEQEGRSEGNDEVEVIACGPSKLASRDGKDDSDDVEVVAFGPSKRALKYDAESDDEVGVVHYAAAGASGQSSKATKGRGGKRARQG